MSEVDYLPAYIYCDVEGCTNKHYLSFNRDIQGKWSVGYVEFENHQGVYTSNGFESIESAAAALRKELNDA